MMILDKIVDQLQVYDADFVFMETEDNVYTTTVIVDNFELLIELVLDESDGLVLVSGTLFLSTEPIHTQVYVDDNYEQVLNEAELGNSSGTIVITLPILTEFNLKKEEELGLISEIKEILEKEWLNSEISITGNNISITYSLLESFS